MVLKTDCHKTNYLSHNKQRYVWQDHCKGLAILLVVLGHMLDHENLYHGETIGAYLIYGFHMPLFFLLSGYTLSVSTDNGLSDFSNYVKKHTKRILLPGILFIILEFLIDSIIACISGIDNLMNSWHYYTNIEALYHTLAMDSRSIIPQYWFFQLCFLHYY